MHRQTKKETQADKKGIQADKEEKNGESYGGGLYHQY